MTNAERIEAVRLLEMNIAIRQAIPALQIAVRNAEAQYEYVRDTDNDERRQATAKRRNELQTALDLLEKML